MKHVSIVKVLSERTGISDQQASDALQVVMDFAKERFPILEGTIDSFLQEQLSRSQTLRGSDD